MAKASDNQYPSLLLVEQSSPPAAPAAGSQRIYFDLADHKLKRINSAGVVTTVEGVGGTSSGGDGTVNDPSTWSADLGYDVEFTTASSSLPAGWSWVNQGTSTFEAKYGAGIITAQPGSGPDNGQRCIVRALPTQATWEATACLGYTQKQTNGARTSLMLRESATGKIVEIGPNPMTALGTGNTGHASNIECNKWTTTGTYSAAIAAGTYYETIAGRFYLKIRRNSANSHDFLVSNDGTSWITHAAAADISTFMTPDQIGVMNAAASNVTKVASIQWFRVR